MVSAIEAMRSVNPELKILLTVSPVPLTATASPDHVMVATTRSKSVLRAVAAHLAENDPRIDYFPSYELITSPPVRGTFFEPNMRSVNPHGVSLVMSHFFSSLEAKFGKKKADAPLAVADGDVVCEEQLLASFGRET